MRAITNPNDLVSAEQVVTTEKYKPGIAIVGGITKREHFAAMILQGLLARDTSQEIDVPEFIAAVAINHADALIDALNAED